MINQLEVTHEVNGGNGVEILEVQLFILLQESGNVGDSMTF